VGDEHSPGIFDRLVYASVSDTDLGKLHKFKNLKALELGLDLSRPSVSGLSKLKNLEAIGFYFGTNPATSWEPEILDTRLARVLNPLDRLPKLWLVQAGGDGVGDQSVKVLARLPRLRAAWFTGCSFRDAGMNAIADCATLESLYLHETNVSAEGLSYLQRLPKLRSLSVSSPWLDGAAFEQILELSQVEELRLGGVLESPTKLHLLANLPKLKRLSLPTDTNPTELKRLRQLLREDVELR
jgi:hypothetical protein